MPDVVCHTRQGNFRFVDETRKQKPGRRVGWEREGYSQSLRVNEDLRVVHSHKDESHIICQFGDHGELGRYRFFKDVMPVRTEQFPPSKENGRYSSSSKTIFMKWAKSGTMTGSSDFKKKKDSCVSDEFGLRKTISGQVSPNGLSKTSLRVCCMTRLN